MTPPGIRNWIQQRAAGNISLGAQQAFDPFIIPNNINGGAFLQATKSGWMSTPYNLSHGYALELERLKSFTDHFVYFWCCNDNPFGLHVLHCLEEWPCGR
jgi:hypothetical protein